MTPVRFELAAPRVSEGVGKYGVQVQSVLMTSKLIFYRGERRSMPKNLFKVGEVGHHWPAYQGNTI